MSESSGPTIDGARSVGSGRAVAVVVVMLSFLLIGGMLVIKWSEESGPPNTGQIGPWYEDLIATDSPTEPATFDESSGRFHACSFEPDTFMRGIAGAVLVTPGDDAVSLVENAPPGTTFIFESGIHDLSRALEAQDDDRFLGASGAVIDGGFRGDAGAIKGAGRNVEVGYLAFRNFGTPEGLGSVNSAAVNRSVADGWWVHHSHFDDNDGAALFLGAHSVTEYNCFDGNGQYGISLPSRRSAEGEVAITDVVVRNNEFVRNNRNDLERSGACSGCTGAMKFWSPERLEISGNYVHDNNGSGIWIDHNGVDVTIEGNLVVDNDKAGIIVETSYNTRIWSNVLITNAVGVGEARPSDDPFPDPGIFVSGSGGVDGLGMLEGIVDIAGNRLEQNFNGVTLFEDSDRFCSAVANQSVGRCTLTGGTIDQCVALAGDPDGVERFQSECRWRTRHVAVHHNRFVAPEHDVGRDDCATQCTRNSAFATVGSTSSSVTSSTGETTSLSLSPRTDGGEDISSVSLNAFFRNSYTGDWRFSAPRAADRLDASGWRRRGQDVESNGMG